MLTLLLYALFFFILPTACVCFVIWFWHKMKKRR